MIENTRRAAQQQYTRRLISQGCFWVAWAVAVVLAAAAALISCRISLTAGKGSGEGDATGNDAGLNSSVVFGGASGVGAGTSNVGAAVRGRATASAAAVVAVVAVVAVAGNNARGGAFRRMSASNASPIPRSPTKNFSTSAMSFRMPPALRTICRSSLFIMVCRGYTDHTFDRTQEPGHSPGVSLFFSLCRVLMMGFFGFVHSEWLVSSYFGFLHTF
jgi:hypothetical protein